VAVRQEAGVLTDMEIWAAIRRRVLTGEISKRQACVEYEIHWQRVALDELHRQERAAVGEDAEVMRGRDPWVLELASDAGLILEPTGRPRVWSVLVQQHFDRHLAAKHCIGSAVYNTHPATGDLFTEGVAFARWRRGVAVRGVIATFGSSRIGDRCS
jgi:hypothetical protein